MKTKKNIFADYVDIDVNKKDKEIIPWKDFTAVTNECMKRAAKDVADKSTKSNKLKTFYM